MVTSASDFLYDTYLSLCLSICLSVYLSCLIYEVYLLYLIESI